MFLFAAVLIASAEPVPVAPAPRPVVRAVAVSSLATGNEQIRQFAFDADPDTAFASAKNAAKGDSFTLVFDTPVNVKSVRVTTGRPKGGDALAAGVLEVSADGKAFEESAKFEKGTATGGAAAKVKAVRVRVTEDLDHPLVVREIAVDAEPAVAVFRHPVELFDVPGLAILVPGSIGLRCLASLLSEETTKGVYDAFQMFVTAMAIVAGLLFSNSLSRQRGVF